MTEEVLKESLELYGDLKHNEQEGTKIIKESLSNIRLLPLNEGEDSWYWFQCNLGSHWWVSRLPIEFEYMGVDAWQILGPVFLDIYRDGSVSVVALDPPYEWLEVRLSDEEKDALLSRFSYRIYAFDKDANQEYMVAFCSSAEDVEIVAKVISRYEDAAKSGGEEVFLTIYCENSNEKREIGSFRCTKSVFWWYEVRIGDRTLADTYNRPFRTEEDALAEARDVVIPQLRADSRYSMFEPEDFTIVVSKIER